MTHIRNEFHHRRRHSWKPNMGAAVSVLGIALLSLSSSCSSGGDKAVQASGPTVTVGVTKVVKKIAGAGRHTFFGAGAVPGD